MPTIFPVPRVFSPMNAVPSFHEATCVTPAVKVFPCVRPMLNPPGSVGKVTPERSGFVGSWTLTPGYDWEKFAVPPFENTCKAEGGELLSQNQGVSTNVP